MAQTQNLVKVSSDEIGFIVDHFKRHRGLGSLLQTTVSEQSGKEFSRRAIWEQLKYRPDGNDPLVINEARRLLEATIGVRFELSEA